jgi:UPF0042 nucleotide-binding protein
MALTRLLLVVGLSGAGKSQTMKSLEDLGFSCVDNLPPVMVEEMLRLATSHGVEQLAITPDVRSSGEYGDAAALIDRLRRGALPLEVLFLDASEEVLVRRYSETRRRHPFGSASRPSGAIALERASLAPLQARADRSWDTSRLTYTDLKAKVAETYHGSGLDAGRLAVTVIAFGFKFGLPLDADLVFDVRFLANPNYAPELKALTGEDEPVAAFIEALPETAPFLAHLQGLLTFLLPQYLREGKSHLTIAVGCTGGRHRSVYIARRVVALLGSQAHEEFDVSYDARDLAR